MPKSADPVPSTPWPCTAAALALMCAGVAVLLSAVGGEGFLRAASAFASLPVHLQAIAAVGTVCASICASSVVFGREALLLGYGFACTAVLAAVTAASVVGWALAFGISPTPRLLAFGSPAEGLGALSILVGIVALACCRTAPARSGARWASKAETAAIAAFFLLVAPGFLALVYGDVEGRKSMAVETGAFGG